ncbi:hypothetical protein PQR46_09160 [Paraburkholderia sediminicola]|uniref:hypothetical protein n=1 Tax=Paraburkholderia TaxID=1822464 RepID=UPI0038BA7882
MLDKLHDEHNTEFLHDDQHTEWNVDDVHASLDAAAVLRCLTEIFARFFRRRQMRLWT